MQLDKVCIECIAKIICMYIEIETFWTNMYGDINILRNWLNKLADIIKEFHIKQLRMLAGVKNTRGGAEKYNV